jgi:hypothetical protein
MKNDKIKEKIRSESEAIIRITNNDLQCKDCVFKFDDSEIFGNTSKCEAYDSKPDNVLLNKEECEYYESE